MRLSYDTLDGVLRVLAYCVICPYVNYGLVIMYLRTGFLHCTVTLRIIPSIE